jgi:cytochrome c-type biogenesis protein CcmF
MILGVTLTSLTFISLIICIVSYLLAHYKKDNDLTKLARWAFFTSSGLIFIQASILMWGILAHQFQWQYIFSYSSRDMSVFYLITTFWGGQEGTFLLWLMLGSIYGILLIRKSDRDEKIVMVFMALIQAFIVIILIKKNPFSYVWEARPQQFQLGEIPIDGNGLNPLLQNPWMIIHPPILFTGYSSSMILFAFGMTALITKDYKNWIKNVFPFSIFVGLSLGTGIILGGYWAYTTLGWGGYWGWDPVENSSFIPWLSSLALIHGLMIQRRKGSLQRTNVFLALLTFILVLYGSFLTRSGVLSDFSVHSFSQSEINDYLLGFFVFFLAVGIIFFIFRKPPEKSLGIGTSFFTRENFMFFGMLTLLLSSILTFFGTSTPLLSGIFLGQASDVSIEYYNLLNTPVALLLGFFISISPALSWRKTQVDLKKKLAGPLVSSFIITVIAFFLGIGNLIHLVIFFLFIFAIFINLEMVIKMIRKKNWGFGGYLSHVGIGLMMMGIITSNAYETNVKTTLPLNSPKKVLEYDMKYVGFRTGDDGKDEAIIEIQGTPLKNFVANPKFYWSEFNQAYMRNPSVHNLWVKDVYVSPIQVIPAEENEQAKEIKIQKGGQVNFEEFVVEFIGYEMDGHDTNSGKISISAVINILYEQEKHEIRPSIIIQDGKQKVNAEKFPHTSRSVSIADINVEDNTLTLKITDDQIAKAGTGIELLAVEVTEKPLINMLWLGTILMIVGLFISFIYRTRISRL